jgi:hypothetical protein
VPFVPKSKEPVNPFYVLLVILGIVFLITACAYGVMAYRAMAPAQGGDVNAHPLTRFLDRHGIALLGWELGLLAAATFAAMWLDRFRSQRDQRNPSPPSDADPRREIR